MSMKRVRQAQAEMMLLGVMRYRLLLPESFDGRTVRSLIHRGWAANTGGGLEDGTPVYAITLLGFRWLIDYLTDNATTVEGIDTIAKACLVFVIEYKKLELHLLAHFPNHPSISLQ